MVRRTHGVLPPPSPPAPDRGSSGGGKTPRSNELEAARLSMKQSRTPAYGDALKLCRRLEAELQQAQSRIAELERQLPREGQFYRLGGQVDDVVQGHVLIEARPTRWCSIQQEWIEE